VTQPADVKACCAAVYSSDAVHWLFGDALHPGGEELTERLTRTLGVGPGDVVLDVGSGLGTSALAIASATPADVVGVDLSGENVARARARASEADLDGRVSFLQADAEALPLADGSVAGVVCECSFCLFPDKPTVAAELARVLRPGGRLALADVTARPAELPAELRTVTAWTACFADARPLQEISDLIGGAGLSIERVEEHDDALAELVDRVEGRLRLASAFGAHLRDELRDGVERGLELVSAVRRALGTGIVGYGAIYGRRNAS
jgi:arsenite methyltransferase